MFPKDTTILVVDDSQTLRSRLAADLGELGFTKLIERSDGDEGWDALESNYREGRPIGLVLLDIRMERVNGLELLARIRQSAAFSGLPVVMVSAESGKKSLIEAIKIGANGYVFKPFERQALERCLESVWQRVSG